MQATNLIDQLQGASARPTARANAQPQPEHSGAQFSQALSREMGQRAAVERGPTDRGPTERGPTDRGPTDRGPTERQPASAAQRTASAPKPADKAQSRQAEKSQPKQAEKAQSAKQETSGAGQSGAAGEGEAASAASQAAAASDEAAAEATARAAELPVTDMLALVAGINQLQALAPKDAALATPPAGGAGTGQATGLASGLATGIASGIATGLAAAADAGLASETTAFAAPALATAVAGDDAAALAITPGKDILPVADAGEPAQFAATLRERIEAVPLRDAQAATTPIGQAQAVTLNMAQATAGVTGDRIPARVGSAAWDNQISQKVVFMLAGKDQSATLTLNPPDLGPVQVVLSVSNDQASVAFSANQLEVRQALENAMPKLKEMLGESGIALGNATVDAGTQEQRQAQAGRDARGARGQHPGADGAAVADGQAARPVRTATLPGRVDTFA